ncbi:hypothetical protein HGP28_18105 [Vibrio sp. SM6]|uniref:HEAT repeat domain-containing protein n=1 Tax=Vibrio agarilyticus TaxID=2726741 RepID=A0A7X8TTW4_9VIBR|nr:hypothetical protein [Vibrio agarilyticus]NLS14774.1 hypothetical protein [Vibrio agarilyticus]
MRHGRVARHLISTVAIWLCMMLSVSHASTAVSVKTIEQWQKAPSLRVQVDILLGWVASDDIDSLRRYLSKMSLMQQEATKYHLLRSVEEQSITLSPSMSLLVAEWSKQHPQLLAVERGEGYHFTRPAFHYSAVANRLLKQWRQDQSIIELTTKAEQKHLFLSEWLSGTSDVVYEREALLCRQFAHLSKSAQHAITQQVLQTSPHSFLPSSRLLVTLARVSDDDALYQLIWRLKPDHVIREELYRLANIDTSNALSRLLLASRNPSLSDDVIHILSERQPLDIASKQRILSHLDARQKAQWHQAMHRHSAKLQQRSL